MIKRIISILIISLCTTSLFAVEFGSKVDIGFFYHPSITLDNTSDLPVFSSIGSTYDFSPIYLKINNHIISPYLSIFHVSRSIVYQNEFLREFSAVGFGFDYGYYFNEKFLLHTKLSMGVGKLGQSLNQEMYANLLLAPSILLIKENDYDLSLQLIVNVIYRKYLLSPSIGIGLSTSFDWLTSYIGKMNETN